MKRRARPTYKIALFSGGLLGVYPLNTQVDKGPACFNIPNNWEVNMLYHFPNLMKENGFLAKMVNGWFISSIVSIQSGQPFTPIADTNRLEFRCRAGPAR